MPADSSGMRLGGPVEAGGTQAWHDLLRRLAGTLPGDLISEAQAWLADGQTVDVAQCLAFAAAAANVPLRKADAELITAELSAAGEDTQVVHNLDLIDESIPTPIARTFAPKVTPPKAESATAAVLDLTDPGQWAELDEIDRAAVVVAQTGSEAIGVWRSWRAPADQALGLAPRRLFIVLTTLSSEAGATPAPDGGSSGGPDALTARLHEALVAAGETDPQVEVRPEELPATEYQNLARSRSALLWAREPAMPIQLAQVFDAVDAERGPSFDPEHPRIEEVAEIDSLLDYLDAGEPLLLTTATMADVVDPRRPDVVPLSFRTDGQWIWMDTVTYYLDHYSLAPEARLLAHLRSMPVLPPPVSTVGMYRALALLQPSDDTEPVWVVPMPGRAG